MRQAVSSKSKNMKRVIADDLGIELEAMNQFSKFKDQTTFSSLFDILRANLMQGEATYSGVK